MTLSEEPDFHGKLSNCTEHMVKEQGRARIEALLMKSKVLLSVSRQQRFISTIRLMQTHTFLLQVV